MNTTILGVGERNVRVNGLGGVEVTLRAEAPLVELFGYAGARGRCGKPSLFYAIESGDSLPMLRWLLGTGASVEARDKFGATPLMAAVEQGNLGAVAGLLEAGAEVDANGPHDQTALSSAQTRDIALALLEAGADPRHLPTEARRALLGLPPDPDEDLLEVSPAEFARGRTRRFGRANPERLDDAFCQGMIRAGIDAWQAAQRFEDQAKVPGFSPVWCARRFGQSFTFLPDGRIVQVGGEHEDYYDPDFCIYNDVFVHEPDGGAIQIFGYPAAVFPPTDFHTATLLGSSIYLIGSLGYPDQRRYGTTPVYRLDVDSWRIEEINPGGEGPGWIHGHRATALSADEIRVSGGAIMTWVRDDKVHSPNERTFILHVGRCIWTPL